MNRSTRGALTGRLSVFRHLLLFLLLVPVTAPADDNPCRPASYDDRVHISYVIDGDTVVLASGEKLRLIGLDTPELGRDGATDEPGAVAARLYLQQLLQADASYPLSLDREQRDRYGRLLGHLFLPDGQNVQAMLLAEGLGTPFAFPPNLRFIACYYQQAGLARDNRKGVWRLPRYQPLNVSALTGAERGYHVISGRVSRVGNSRSSLWLNLSDRFAIRIQRSDLKYFDGLDLSGLTGKDVTVRGMIYRSNGRQRIRIRHPGDLQLPPLLPKTH